MKVLIISPDFPPVKGGIGDWIFHLFCHLKATNMELELVTTNKSEIKSFINGHRLNDVFPLINWSLFGLIKLARTIKCKGPDVLHIEYPGGFGVPLRYKYRSLMSIFPLILKLCDYDGKIFLRLHEFGEVRFATRILASILMLTVDKVAIASQIDLRRIIKLLPLMKDKVEFVPSGSNIPYINYTPDQISATKQLLKTHSNQFIVGYFGFIRKGKGVETLFKACKILVEKGIHLRVLMLSELKPCANSYHKKILKTIRTLNLENYIHFTGFLDPKTTSKYLQCMDSIVLPFDRGASLRRGSLIAAVMHKLPIVVTKSKFIDQNLLNSNGILFVPPHNQYALAHTLEELIFSEELRHQLSENVSTIASAFSWGNIVNKIMKSYCEVLNI